MRGPAFRLVIYALAGFLFGILDWYYLDILAHFPWGDLGESILVIPVIILLNYGIWLVIVVPVALIEARASRDWRLSALAGVVVWASAILSYYLFYLILLAFWGLPQMDHLLFANRNTPGFWHEWSIAFKRIILAQFLEWIVVAVVGGAIVGFLVGKLSPAVRSRLSRPSG